MATTCEMASYAQHERTPAMVDRVRKFSSSYPNSEFLKSLVDPVREVQAKNIEPFLEAKDHFGTIDFFEKTRKSLYPKVADNLAYQLFVAYVDTNKSEKAEEFLNVYRTQAKGDLDTLRLAVALSELSEKADPKKLAEFTKESRGLAKTIENFSAGLKADDAMRLYLVRIMSSKQADVHYPWVMKLAMSWAEKDISTACNMVYPLLEKYRMSQGNEVSPKLAENFISSNLMDMLRFETNCAYSLMEYELGLYKGRMKELASLYEKRTFVPLNTYTANVLWNVAEGCRQEGASSEARRIWQYLVDKGSQDLPEVRFAKARLDSRRTELENLWGK
jgi:hypothetical protein